MFKMLLITIFLVAFCVLALAVKMLFRKDGEFSHKCAMKDLGEGASCCSHTGRHEDCPSYQLHHGNTASRMAKAVEMADSEQN